MLSIDLLLYFAGELWSPSLAHQTQGGALFVYKNARGDCTRKWPNGPKSVLTSAMFDFKPSRDLF